MKEFKRILRKVHHYIVISALHSEPHYKFLGILGFLGFPICYLVWNYIAPQSYENLTLRLVFSALCLLIALHEYWPDKLKVFFPYFWFTSLLLILPFFFNFMLLKNNINTVWLMSGMTGLFILILTVDWIWLLLLFITGSCMAWIVFLLDGGSTSLFVSYFGVMAIYFFIGIVGALFIINTGRQQKENAAMASLIRNVAHELRTPLSGLRGAIAGFKKYLPILHEAYTKAGEAGIVLPKIRRNHINNLLPALDRMSAEIHFANTIIDMLLMNVGRDNIDPNNFEICSINKVIKETLSKYPFDSSELEAKIHWDKRIDFQFNGSAFFLEHVLFNLIKNALHFIVKAEKGEIFIWLETNDAFNQLHFKDTGHGVPAPALPLLFERFFTTTLTGTGIGLSFCKIVMRKFGGEILCDSIEGKYAEFILRFPLADAVEK